MRLCTARAMLSAAGGGVAGAYQEPARSSSIRPCRPRVKIKLRASDSCERGHRRSEWALGFNVKLMAGISVPVPSVDDGAIADRLGPPSESGRELQPREGFFRGSPPPRFVLTGEGSGMRCPASKPSDVISYSNRLLFQRLRPCRSPYTEVHSRVCTDFSIFGYARYQLAAPVH